MTLLNSYHFRQDLSPTSSSLRRAYEQGAIDVDATTLQEVADLMILRRDEITYLDEGPFQEPDLPREVS